MVRTKADAATARVSGAKAPRKIQVAPSATAKKTSSSSGGGGGNPYCPRETPKWQKEITKFFQPKISENSTIQADATEPNNQEQIPDNVEQIQASNGKRSDDEGEASSEAA